ncbi:MAG: hypothetical protein A2Y41_07715 [Spirochaetes bacterium GWB1_36_13]|nr:MAG: hypothetical protein A2Y41_07715 [Spirochaetes bacterium GWB1_36_13]
MLLYDKIYQSNDFQKIPIQEYFSLLIDDIIINFPENPKVKIEKNISDFIMSVKTIFNVGIIMNELLTKQIEGKIRIEREQGTKIILEFKK